MTYQQSWQIKARHNTHRSKN